MIIIGFFSILALILDLIGVILLFKFGILPDNLWEHLLMDNGMDEDDENRHRKWSKIGLTCLISGFSIQLITTIFQNIN
jgi:hypothetical protein